MILEKLYVIPRIANGNYTRSQIAVWDIEYIDGASAVGLKVSSETNRASRLYFSGHFSGHFFCIFRKPSGILHSAQSPECS
ncbi:MAG: hypothetical protein AAF685_01585 [Cyanobacteria bacterium P01_C01_bin.89]